MRLHGVHNLHQTAKMSSASSGPSRLWNHLQIKELRKTILKVLVFLVIVVGSLVWACSFQVYQINIYWERERATVIIMLFLLCSFLWRKTWMTPQNTIFCFQRVVLRKMMNLFRKKEIRRFNFWRSCDNCSAISCIFWYFSLAWDITSLQKLFLSSCF